MLERKEGEDAKSVGIVGQKRVKELGLKAVKFYIYFFCF